MISIDNYLVSNPAAFETPAMLVFDEVLEHNLNSIGKLVGGAENLFVHVKTHKSLDVARRQVALGVAGFKCATLKELEMVLQAGAGQAILAFPQTQERKLSRLCDLVAAYPGTKISAIASSMVHADLLASTAEKMTHELGVMLDLDAGMHRTGIGFGEQAVRIYEQVHKHKFLRADGLHLYDGHDRHQDPVKRQASAETHIRELRDFARGLEAQGFPVPRMVGGGSWSFPYYARAEGMHGSPGTFVYWDHYYGSSMPELPFRCAALVLTQVVDRYPEQKTVTTDLGSKGISSDRSVEGRAFILGHESARMVGQSEEHGVFRFEGELPEIGDYLLAIPGHICPTTIRYPGSFLVGAEGHQLGWLAHTARDRV